LPFEDASFDLVVAYNSLMDVDDLPGVVLEAARVLEPGGRCCVCVSHPLLTAGRFESKEPDAPFVISGSYFGRRRFEGTFERAGLTITFHSWDQPLEAYAHAFEDAGFVFEFLREPSVPEEDARHSRIPLFLFWRALKR
jgi:SAM-dependent methyltransferase